MKVAEILMQYDSNDGAFDYHLLTSDMGRVSDDEKATKEFGYEMTAFGLQPNAQGEPWGFYYGPQLTFADKDGNPVYVPAKEDITADAVLYWEQRYKQAKHPLLIMRYADLVWDFKRRIVKQNYDDDLYRTLVDSMLRVCNKDLASHPEVTVVILERLFGIVKNSEADTKLAKWSLNDFTIRHGKDENVSCWACQLQLMMKYKKLFSKEEIATAIEKHEERLKRLTLPSDDTKTNPWIASQQSDLLAEYYHKEQKIDDVRRVLHEAEKTFVQSSDKMIPLQKMGIMEGVYRKYQHYGLKEDADRVAIKLQQMGGEAKDSLTPQQYEFEIPKEVHDQAKLMFGEKASSDNERWQNFAVYFIPRKSEEDLRLAELVKQFPLRYMVQENMMDLKGHPMSVVGSYENDHDGRLILHITEKLNLNTHFLGIAMHHLWKSGCLTTEKLMSDLIEPCPLFDEDRYVAIREGLNAMMNNNHMVACHLLVPQIEYAICNLVEKSGVSILKPQRKGKGFQLRVLDELLREKAVVDTFTEDGAYYLRLVLTDQRSLNIRNLLSHGILPPDYFNSGVSARLFHVLVMIGLVREK